VALHGLIIYNGFLQGNKFLDFAEMLQHAAVHRGHHIQLKTNDELINDLTGSHMFANKTNELDYVIFTDKDIYLANTLERARVPVFNNATSIEISDDKIKTYERLVDEHIPIPKTIVAPKTFGMNIHPEQPFLQHIIDSFQYPFIMKEAFGSFGEQVYLVRNETDVHYYLKKINGAPFVFQEYIEASYGVDLRLQVVGDRVVAAMKRSSESDFRANVTSGGTMESYVPTAYEAELAINATKAIGAHFAGVDILLGDRGKRYVCEVNSNAHIRNLYECTNINVAPDIIDHIEQQLT